jgi:HEPN domain-containing protein
MSNHKSMAEGSFPPEQEVALLFLEKANQDLVAVGKWLTDPEIVDEIIGFHIQQAIEKSVKAILVSQKIDYPRTHNLGLLLEICRNNQIQIPSDFSQIDRFNRFAVQWRYDLLPSTDPPAFDRKAAYELATRILTWAIDSVNEVF